MNSLTLSESIPSKGNGSGRSMSSRDRGRRSAWDRAFSRLSGCPIAAHLQPTALLSKDPIDRRCGASKQLCRTAGLDADLPASLEGLDDLGHERGQTLAGMTVRRGPDHPQRLDHLRTMDPGPGGPGGPPQGTDGLRQARPRAGGSTRSGRTARPASCPCPSSKPSFAHRPAICLVSASRSDI